MTLTPQSNPDLPSWQSPEYCAMKPGWELCRDVRELQDVIDSERSTYLPKFDAESPADWDARIKLTKAPSFLDQGIQIAVGLMTRHEPQLNADAPEQLKQYWETFDDEGNHGAVTTQKAIDRALQDGHVVLLTECPPAPEGLRAGEEAARGIRPYAVLVGADEIPSWQVEMVGAELVTTLFVRRETYKVAAGKFGTVNAVRYRVYRQFFGTAVDREGRPVPDHNNGYVMAETWNEKVNASGAVTEITMEGDPVLVRGPSRIPIAPLYGGLKKGHLQSRPAYIDVAHQNVRWAQVESERASTLHKAGIIMLIVAGKLQNDPETGKPVGEIVAKQGGALLLEEGGTADWAEPAGSALEQQAAEREAIENRIAGLCLAMMMRSPVKSQTATAERREGAKDESLLQQVVRSAEDALERTFGYFAQFIDKPEYEIDVSIRTDFDLLITDGTIKIGSELQEKGQLRMATLQKLIERSGMMGNDFDPDEETTALEDADDEESQVTDLSLLSLDELRARQIEIEAQIAERAQTEAA